MNIREHQAVGKLQQVRVALIILFGNVFFTLPSKLAQPCNGNFVRFAQSTPNNDMNHVVTSGP